MFVKQIDMKEAFELAARGKEIKVLVPTGPGTGWEAMLPDTLQNMLADAMFFRSEPALEKEMIDVRDDPPPDEARSEEEKAAGTVKPVGKRKLEVDTGKLLALRKAGWPIRKIAEELRISEGSVCNYLKKAEERNGEES